MVLRGVLVRGGEVVGHFCCASSSTVEREECNQSFITLRYVVSMSLDHCCTEMTRLPH